MGSKLGGLRFDIFEHDYFLKRQHRLKYTFQRLSGIENRSADKPLSIRRSSTHRRSRHQRKKSVRFKSPKAKFETVPNKNPRRTFDSRRGTYLWMWVSYTLYLCARVEKSFKYAFSLSLITDFICKYMLCGTKKKKKKN